MAIEVRSYHTELGDFERVCDFLIRMNGVKMITPHYLWARWVWQFGPYMSKENLSKIGIVEEEGKIIGLVTYENNIGEAYFCLDEEYKYLKGNLIDYAKENLSSNGAIKITIPDGDLGYQMAAVEKGFIPTSDKYEDVQ